MNYESLTAFMEDLPELAASAKDRLRGCQGTFRLETAEGRVCEIEIHPEGDVTFGPLAGEPDCTVTASERDLLAVIQGKMSPARALLLRKVRARGQVGKLMTLAALVA